MLTRRKQILIQTMLLPVIYQANYVRPLTGKWTVRPARRQQHSKLLCVSLQLYIAFNVVFRSRHCVFSWTIRYVSESLILIRSHLSLTNNGFTRNIIMEKWYSSLLFPYHISIFYCVKDIYIYIYMKWYSPAYCQNFTTSLGWTHLNNAATQGFHSNAILNPKNYLTYPNMPSFR